MVRAGHGDVRRDVRRCRQFLRHDRSERRVFQRRQRRIAAAEVLRAKAVIGQGVATPRRIVNLSAQAARSGSCPEIRTPRTVVAIGLSVPRYSAGGVGLHVEGVQVRRTAAESEEDRGFGSGALNDIGRLQPEIIG